jgi:hypothetical protein
VGPAEGEQLLHERLVGLDPGAGCTTALTSSPRSGFGTPNTAASATLGWVIRRFSVSCGYTLTPPEMIMNVLRSVR